MTQSAQNAMVARVLDALMATSRLTMIVLSVRTITAIHILTAVVAPRARLRTGVQRVTTRVVQGVQEMCAIRMTAAARHA